MSLWSNFPSWKYFNNSYQKRHREIVEPTLRNGLLYKRFISLVHTFAPAQKRIVFYKMKVMQSSFSETRHMRRRIPLPLRPCPPLWLIFIFRCLLNDSHSPLCYEGRRGIGVPQLTFFRLSRCSSDLRETSDRISSASVLFHSKNQPLPNTTIKKACFDNITSRSTSRNKCYIYIYET